MAVSSETNAADLQTNGTSTPKEMKEAKPAEEQVAEGAACSIDTAQPLNGAEFDSLVEFTGDVNTDNDLPSKATLREVENFMLLDRDGRAIQFKDVYGGKNGARRVLVIFIRHFYCGNCQEYLRALTESVKPDDLLNLPTPTFIAIIGCGSPSMIPSYQNLTSCPFPIYADPTKALYEALGMIRTLVMGGRPEYQRRGTMKGMFSSIAQGMGQLARGKGWWEAGDMQQVGGEFMFEPTDISTPINGPGQHDQNPFEDAGIKTTNGSGRDNLGEDKTITWCHRMRNTRDHAEIPELREVLGLDGEGVPGKDKKRWVKALKERKGTGLSSRTSMSLDGVAETVRA